MVDGIRLVEYALPCSLQWKGAITNTERIRDEDTRALDHLDDRNDVLLQVVSIPSHSFSEHPSNGLTARRPERPWLSSS